MTSTGGFLKKYFATPLINLSRRVRKTPLWGISLAVSICALFLRTWNSGHLNNNIMDLNARQVLMAVDIIRGHIHFPNGPWVFEYDEAGLAWLLVPWIMIFGHKWVVIKNFGAILASITPGVVTWITGKRWNPRLGLTAGLLMTTLPAQLVWDRHLVMCATAVSSIAWLIGLHLVSRHRRFGRYSHGNLLIAGVIIGLSTYVVHYSPMIMPVLYGIILYDGRIFRERWTTALLRISSVSIACGMTILPLLVNKYHNPQYLLWRKRHLIEWTGDLSAVAVRYFLNLWIQFRELFLDGGRFFYLHDHIPVFTPVFSLLVFAGIYHLLKRDRYHAVFILGTPLLMYLLMGLTRAEDWRGVYHVHTMIFFSMAAAMGVRQFGQYIAVRMRPVQAARLVAACVTALAIFHTAQFITGPYRIFPLPDSLTRLQRDMMEGRGIPYLFSSRIQEVMHYHMSFWYVTRVDHPRVSIYEWDEQGWYTHPDRKPVVFETDPDARVGFVIRPENLDAFIEKMGKARIKSWRRLPHSGVIVVQCRVKIPEIFKRTWTESLVPPILDIKRDR